MVIWNGACTVHEEFSLASLVELKQQHPAAKVVAHPECPAAILEQADYIGSTAGILTFCGKDSAQEYIVVTEPGILTEMNKRLPEKTFIPAPGHQSSCNECRYMKMVTLENIVSCLENESPEVVLEESVRQAAEKAILNMIAIK
jgi:quinolinate synthase